MIIRKKTLSTLKDILGVNDIYEKVTKPFDNKYVYSANGSYKYYDNNNNELFSFSIDTFPGNCAIAIIFHLNTIIKNYRLNHILMKEILHVVKASNFSLIYATCTDEQKMFARLLNEFSFNEENKIKNQRTNSTVTVYSKML